MSESQRERLLSDFEDRAGIHFKKRELLDSAFSHRSCSGGAVGRKSNNERLEFLGDSVLSFVVAEYLYKTFPDRAEGELACLRGRVVSRESLVDLAREMELGTCLLVGKGEAISGGRNRGGILADALEAVIGAYYLDSGIGTVSDFICRWFAPKVEEALANRGGRDCKSILQEYAQEHFKGRPVYDLIKTTGPDHDRVFWVSVSVGGRSYGPATGKTRRAAEQGAAERAWGAVREIDARKIKR